MPNLNPEHLQAVMKAINQGPFFRHLSMKVTELGAGFSVVELKVGKKHLNPFGGLHGGVCAAALDTAAYWSGYVEAPEGKGLITIDLRVDYLGPVTDDRIIARGRTIKPGKNLILTEATIFGRDGKALAHGLSKLMVTPELQSIDDVARCLGAGRLPPKFR